MVDVLREHSDPNQRCTCGWRRFRDVTSSVEQAITCWVFYDTETGAGFGASEFGTYFGSGTDGAWGEFPIDVTTITVTVVCENCTRQRTSRIVSEGGAFGGYVFGECLYIVVCGATATGCFTVEWRGPGGTLTTFLSVSADPPVPLLISDPPITGPLPSPPVGATVATLLKTKLPPIPISGDYEIVLVNSCGPEISLGTVFLEVDVVVLIPTDAELPAWQDFETEASGHPAFVSIQPGGVGKGIPFDYCDGVVEYDSRFVTLPDAQGWTHVAGGGGAGDPSDWALVDGNVLAGTTPGGTNPSYWEQSLLLTTTPVNTSYGHSEYLFGGAGSHTVIGEGLDFQALVGIDGGAFFGTRWVHEFDLYETALNGSVETQYPVANTPRGYSRAGGFNFGASGIINYNHTRDVYVPGSVGAVVGDQLLARFGDTAGEGLTGNRVRAFHISTPGRFLRAWFRAYTTVAAPVLRLNLVSDVSVIGETTARFLVRYGPAIPNQIPALQASGTISFTSRNTNFELPITLPGLTPNAPFWFTVERDWQHIDNKTESTVWLMQATVRGS